MAVILVVAFPCLALGGTASVSTLKSATKASIKATGHIKRLMLEQGKIVIDKETYLLADDLVVKDDKGNVMTGYKLKYLNAVDLIEYIRIEQTIKEIKILKYTS